MLTAEPALADYFEQVARAHGDAEGGGELGDGRGAARRSRHRGEAIDTFRVRPADLAELLDLVRDGVVSHTAAKQIFARMVADGRAAARRSPSARGSSRWTTTLALARWIDEVIAEHPDEAERFARGEQKLLRACSSALVMKKSKGRADPKRVNQLLGDATRRRRAARELRARSASVDAGMPKCRSASSRSRFSPARAQRVAPNALREAQRVVARRVERDTAPSGRCDAGSP